ncbi:MAG: dsDNA nuclease domain-containing protein [Pseudomonadota bacterium]
MEGGEDETPDAVLDTEDPGDDVALRYRYQHINAAIYALMLVDPTLDVIAVVCENHEDFVVKHRDGAFTGVQVKTRDLKNDAMKANDAQVVKAIRKFCELDRRFPDKFRVFDFSTNHFFWEDKEDHRNIPWLITSISARGSLKGTRGTNPIRQFANAVIDGTEVSLEEFCSTIDKIQLNSRGETINTVRSVLVDAVGQSSFAQDYTYQKAAMFADRLATIALEASSKGGLGTMLEAYSPGSSFNDALEKLTLKGKIIDLEAIDPLIQEFSEPFLEPLKIDGLVPIEDLPQDLARMIQKLAAGELQKVRIDNFTDLVRSFEHLQASWALKHSPAKAKELTETVFSHVLFDCVEAEATVSDESEPFAREKYDYLKDELNARLTQNSETVPGCTLEHLIGVAGILTEQCKVWWSPKFDIESQSDV